jgi:cardiolipin synthase
LRILLAAAAAAALSACAIPEIDREMLHTVRAPVRLEGARGPVSHAQTREILAGIKARSPETAIFDRHLAVEEALAGNPLSLGNKAQLLEDGPATYASMLGAIAAARHHVHMETYIFDGDETGRRFADALMRKARSGVKVRLVFDAVGSMKTPREFFREMVDAGVEVFEFNPVGPAAVLTLGAALNRRNHRKITIVDGRIAFLGGINISGVYSSGARRGGGSAPGARDKPEDERPWRDTHVRIEGPVVADFQRSFLKMWGQLSKAPPLADKALFPPLAKQGPHAVRAVEGWVSEGANPLYVTLISAIESAETEVRITMAYFVPHEELLAALKAAVRRGVDVKLLLPGRTDHWLVFHAGRSYYEELLEAGVQVFERESRLLHSKTAIVDGVWSTVGSTNLDWRSLIHNDEINAVVLGTEFAAALGAIFQRDLANSRAITLESWRQRPAGDRLREASARAWALLL